MGKKISKIPIHSYYLY